MRYAHTIAFWGSRLLVPAVMIFIAVRAVYLAENYNLSTWKGGGMGMFAAADNTYTRYSQVFIEAPDGQRYPIIRLTPEQRKLLDAALLYPIRKNFIPVANDIRATQWAAHGSPEKVRVLDAKGNLIKERPERYQMLIPVTRRPEGQKTDFAIVLKTYQLHYDVNEITLSSRKLNTYRFEETE